MFLRDRIAPLAALVSMVLVVSQPAWGICLGCVRGNRAVHRSATVQRDGLFRGRLFAGRVFDGDGRLFDRASEASCGAAAEASCGAAAEPSCAASDVGDASAAEAASAYEVDDLTAIPPEPAIPWRVTTVDPPRPSRWRVHEVARVRGSSAIVADTNHHPKAVW